MNLTQKLKGGILGLGLLSLTACDTTGEVELAKTEYEGPTKIRLVQEVREGGRDRYRLEVQDSTGTVIAYLRSYQYTESELKVDGKTYELKDKGFRVTKK
ncbi:MAG: hypothetical protein KKC19_03345 [Nanoarchaeota archaeon]|nr:hypothetical protein [Nanoarchaeota archaeon]